MGPQSTRLASTTDQLLAVNKHLESVILADEK